MSNKSCQFCGQANLHWEEFGGKWKLYDAKGNQHVCNKRIRNNDPRIKQKSSILTGDPKIEKALKEFKKRLDSEGKKVYWLKRV